MKNSIIFILILLGVGLGAFFFGSSKGAEKAKSLLEKELPMEQALREVEVSIWETSNAVFYYMLYPSMTSLGEYRHQLTDVTEFMTRYKNLIETDEEKALADKFDISWNQVVSKAEALFQARNEFQETHEKTWDMVHEADDVLNYKLEPSLISGSLDLLAKQRVVRELEVSVWEAISATNYYVYRQFDKPKLEYPAQINDVAEFIGIYKNLTLVDSEKSDLAVFEATWGKAVYLMNQLHGDAEKLAEDQVVFWEAVHKADDIIDFEIRPHLAQRISR